MILAILIAESDQIVTSRPRVGKNPVDLSGDKGCLIASVVDTYGEGFGRRFHGSSV